MASLEEAIVARADGHTALNALIAGRCYPEAADADTTIPYLVYSIISAVRNPTMGKRAQIVSARVQIDCYATTKAACIALRSATILAFDDWSTTTPLIVQHSLLVTERTRVDLIESVGELRRSQLEFIMKYNNPEYV